MSTKFILSILRVGTSFLYYFLIIITLFVIVKDVSRFFQQDSDNYISLDDTSYFKDRKPVISKSASLYSKDKIVRYQQATDLYKVEADLHSGLSYYYMSSTLVFLSLGIFLLWNFKKLFAGISTLQPFNSNLVSRLKLVGMIFILSDILGLIHYFVLGAFINHSLESPKMDLLTDKGYGFVTGLIILIIAMVYQRGVEMEEENRLTV